MTEFLSRYDRDRSAPRFLSALRDAAVRAALPAVVIWLAVVGFGFLLKGPLKGLSQAEEGVSKALERDRTPTWNSITFVWSHLGNTEIIIGVCFLVVAILWWRTREWWWSLVPALAIALQSIIFVTAAWVVQRPRPEVKHLDPAPPTSSYPSGHVSAATALYLTFMMMALRIRRPYLRWPVIAVCALVPLFVVYARLYRGMHHVTDIGVGVVNGTLCSLLAWGYLRREPAPQSGREGVATRGSLEAA